MVTIGLVKTFVLILIVQKVTLTKFPEICLPNQNVCYVGISLKTMDPQVEFESYLGVPYAAPPIAENRFKRPKPFDYGNNRTTFMSMLERPPCTQYSYRFKNQPEGSEDCLYLNIYKPSGLNSSARLVLTFLILVKLDELIFIF